MFISAAYNAVQPQLVMFAKSDILKELVRAVIKDIMWPLIRHLLVHSVQLMLIAIVSSVQA